MHQELNILRSRRSGIFVMHPYAKFKDFGAFLGVPPYREVDGASTPEALGQAILDLLQQSGDSGYHFDDLEACMQARDDEETQRVRETHGLGKEDISEFQFAQQFINGVVQQREAKKSWHITIKCLDPALRAIGGDDLESVRVPHTKGVKKLGEETLRLFDLDRPL